jgi:hypothetical protein
VAESAEALLEQRSRAYRLCFSSPAAKMVLEDLVVFCRANASCYHDDPRLHAALEGRREVWLRITDHFNLSVEDLLKKYRPVMILKPAADETEE